MYKYINKHIIDGYVQSKKHRDLRFFTAVATGDITHIEQLIGDGYDPNTLNDEELTALHVLAEKGDTTTAKPMLNLPNIDINCHVNVRSGDTPLMVAVQFHQFNFAGLLLKYGANPNIRNSRGRTPIFRAVQIKNTTILKVLLFAKAYVDVVDAFGNTPLSFSLIEYPCRKVATMLLKWGANINIKTMKPHPILSELCLNCHTSEQLLLVKLLIDCQANVNVINPITKATPLHIVSITGFTPLARLLLMHGANRNQQDRMGRTPYDMAVEHQHADLIRMYKEAETIVQSILATISVVELEDKPSSSKAGKNRTVRFSNIETTESDDELLLQQIGK